MADDKEVEKTIAEDLVVTKYKLAGQIVNRKFKQTSLTLGYDHFQVLNILSLPWPMDACHGHAANVVFTFFSDF